MAEPSSLPFAHYSFRPQQPGSSSSSSTDFPSIEIHPVGPGSSRSRMIASPPNKSLHCLLSLISYVAGGALLVFACIGFKQGSAPLDPNMGWAIVGAGSAGILSLSGDTYVMRNIPDRTQKNINNTIGILTGIALVVIGVFAAKGLIPGQVIGWCYFGIPVGLGILMGCCGGCCIICCMICCAGVLPRQDNKQTRQDTQTILAGGRLVEVVD